MADQREYDDHPTGLGLTFEDLANSSEPQDDAVVEQREVEDPTDENFAEFDGDLTDDTEQCAEPLRVNVDNAPADTHDFESQPVSAFSPSSSEEDDEDDYDHVREQDQYDNDSETVEEPHDNGARYTATLPSVAEPVPRFSPFRGNFYGDDIYNIYRVHPKTGDISPMHEGTERSAREVKKKKEQNRNQPGSRRMPLSPPVSPDNDSRMPTQVGVLPEPSPEAEAEEDSHVVSPLEYHERPESALGHHDSNANRIWSEEDEEDMSWVLGAIVDISGSRRGSAENSHNAGDGDLPEPSDDPLSPVSPLDKAGALDALRDDSDPNVEDDMATVSETRDQQLESFEESATPPIDCAPVSSPVPAHLLDPTSPDPEGPETLTGLTPHEGIVSWWEWRERQVSYNDHRNPHNQDETGDLRAVFDKSDKDEAADVLSKQRFLFNKETGRDITRVSESIRDVELSHEYVKLSMLKYRHQRNHFRNDAEKFRLDAIEFKARVGRRDQVILEQDDALVECEQMIEKLKTDESAAQTGFHNALDAVERLVAQREKLAKEYEKYKRDTQQSIDEAQCELGIRKRPLQMSSIMTVISEEPIAVADSTVGLQLRSQVDDLAQQLSDSQAARATLDNTCTEFHDRVAQLEEELASKANEELDHATKSQLQAEADDLRAQLQRKSDIESELAASRVQSAELQSRKDDIEAELADLNMTRRANTGATATLSERIEAADALVRDQQATIERLEAENIAWQKYADESEVAVQAEKDAMREEAKALEGALLEHGWSSYAPSRKQTLLPVIDQGTQTEARASSARPKKTVKAIPAPVRAAKKQQVHAEALKNSSGWTSRKQAILQEQSVVAELESRRVAREKRQAVEVERLDRIRHGVGASLDVDELPYVPFEARMVAVAV